MNIVKYFFSNAARTAHHKILSLIVAAAVLALASGAQAASGTWGSLASSATYKDARFQGAGIVLVTPFTSTFSLSIYYNYSPPLDSFATITISNTLPGHRYQVQYADACPPVWFDVSHVTLATGTTKVVTDESVLQAPQRYYRAKLLP